MKNLKSLLKVKIHNKAPKFTPAAKKRGFRGTHYASRRVPFGLALCDLSWQLVLV